MLAILAVGTLWFWLLFIAMIILITILVENDHGTITTLTLILVCLGLKFIWQISILSAIFAHPIATTVYILAYFAVGVGWSVLKWYFYLHKRMVIYRNDKTDFLKEKNITEITPELAAQFVVYHVIPTAKEHKVDIIRWSTYWPFSMLGTALNDIVRKAWEYVYERLQKTYEKMASKMFHEAIADKALAKQYQSSHLR